MARYIHTIDAKGRVIVPARVRNNLDGTLYVAPSLDAGYLSAYNSQQFQAILDQLRDLSGTDKDVRAFRRSFLGSAIACELDSQGRILVNEELWSSIGVAAGEEICFIDMFDKVEICSKAFYDASLAKEPELSDLDLSRFDVKGL
ncbi:MAG: cell division/cell wall cluster transcriptional repressor MraZ [Eubacteriales bacterium]|nr:cell division/cell wall cluster transcriptional repressor MraZ [Eubacteriales bacterium]